MQIISQLVIVEKERSLETNKLMHHTLAVVNNLKQRLDGLVSTANRDFEFKKMQSSF